MNHDELLQEHIEISKIDFGNRAREQYGEDVDKKEGTAPFTDLVNSIKEHGLFHAIVVQHDPTSGKYKLLAGGRRLKACTTLGWETIPARVYTKDLSKLEQKQIELCENLHRLRLSWQEKALLEKQIFDLEKEIKGEKVSTSQSDTGASQETTAKKLGISAGKLSEDLKLAEMLEKIPEVIGGAKTKKEAQAILAMLQKESSAHIRAREVQSTPKEAIHKQLISGYKIIPSTLESTYKDNFISLLSEMLVVQEGIADIAEVDPPYAINLNKEKKTADNSDLVTTNYNEVPEDEYPDFIKNVAIECYRILAPHAWIVWWCPTHWQAYICSVLMEVGFKGRAHGGVWVKGQGQTQQPNLYLASCHENFLYMRKGAPLISKQGRSDVFQYPTVTATAKNHPTERPIEMIQDIFETLIGVSEKKTILCPFLGSGNTLLAGANLGHVGFGWDLAQAYKDEYILKVVNNKPPNYKSYTKKEK